MTPQDEYRFLNNRLDFLSVQMANKQREIAVLQAEFDEKAERMQHIFRLVHPGGDPVCESLTSS